jgi:hypothetical protein
MHKVGTTSLQALAALALISGASQLQASLLFNQPTNNFGGFISQNDTSGGGLGNYSTVYDNFTLGADSTVLAIFWVGSYSNPNVQGAMSGVTISIWGDNSGAPDLSGPLYTTGDMAGNAFETSIGTDFFGSPEFSYGANVNFAATGGTQYWLSIVSDVPLPPEWEWESGTGGDGLSYQNQVTLGSIAVDEAFALSDTAIPEPASTVLVGAGLLLLALGARRLKNRSV